jgi:hypothetical protein
MTPSATVAIGAHVPEEPSPATAKLTSRPSNPQPSPPKTQPSHLENGRVIRSREEEPTQATPITYREYAYLVDGAAEPIAVERLLRSRLEAIAQVLEGRPKGKFVQLAAFDHEFEVRPSRPPLATLSWKDWRGDPVFERPGPASDGAVDIPPVELPQVSAELQKIVPSPVLIAAPPVVLESLPEPDLAPVPQPEPEPAPEPEADFEPEASLESDPGLEPEASPDPGVAEPAPAPAAAAQEAPLDLDIDHGMLSSSSPSSRARPPPAPSSRASAGPAEAGAARPRQRSSEDLIAELFETMHDLWFMPDLIAGAEFVLKVLSTAVPCELTIVHVFDINTRQFVVVRAQGPGSERMLLHRTSDQDSLLGSAMRQRRALRIDNAANDSRYTTGRWQATPVRPESALCGGVQQQGRYLGAIELVNPARGPFVDSEVNALDYVCGQFGEFVVTRPIIVDADVVLRQAR